MRGVHDDVVENQAVRRVQLRKAMPRTASIDGLEDPTVSGAQVKMTGLPRNRGKGACVATSRTNRAPKRLRRQSLPGNRKQ
jgi:hypothetical protein